MPKKNNQLEQLAELSARLRSVRQESLAASRKGDFRAVARLTCEAARINRAMVAVDGIQKPSLEQLGDTLFVSAHDRRDQTPSPFAQPEFALAESA